MTAAAEGAVRALSLVLFRADISRPMQGFEGQVQLDTVLLVTRSPSSGRVIAQAGLRFGQVSSGDSRLLRCC